MYNGESMFYLGLGVEQNFSESIHYLKMAIELGDSDAYFRKIYWSCEIIKNGNWVRKCYSILISKMNRSIEL